MRLSFIMRKDRKDKEGFAVRLRCTLNRKPYYISLQIFGETKDWNPEQERFIISKGVKKVEAKQLNETLKGKNELIERYSHRAKEVITELEKRSVDFTFSQFKEKFFNKTKQGKISSYFKMHIKMLEDTGHIRNAQVYSSTFHILQVYDTNFSLRYFSEIDIHYVKDFDVWLQSERKLVGNSRMFYMKTLRSLWNKAKVDSEAPSSVYPFGIGGFSVNSLSERTEKRYLPTKHLQTLKGSTSKNESNEYARIVFLLSYYLYGMSFIDMAYLKVSDVQRLEDGEYIAYKRSKTKHSRNSKSIKIKISEDVRRLIDKLLIYRSPVGDYLLPLVSINKKDSKELYSHITNKRKRYNEYLKRLADEFALDFNLTSYKSRHTMAMQLQNNRVSEEVISQMLGHDSLETTKVYLDELHSSVLDEAAKFL